jgi:hypothetical protein
LVSNRTFYTDLFDKYRDGLDIAKYAIQYNDRIIYVRFIKNIIFGKRVYAYVMIDKDRIDNDTNKYMKKFLGENI